MLPNKNTIDKTIEALIKNGFKVMLAEDEIDAERIFWDVFSEISPRQVSYGDSLTLRGLNVLNDIKSKDIDFIETFGDDLSWKEQIQNRKRALSSDLFLTGTNAITTKG
ncbi:MAG: LUD domain-containing protein, partial [Clostridia bacterium]|nr:LUD domain-containing protein [Clostridia bacterium]